MINNYNNIARYWKSRENQKHFFDTYAATHHFDPLDPVSWYSVSNTDIENTKVYLFFFLFLHFFHFYVNIPCLFCGSYFFKFLLLMKMIEREVSFVLSPV